MTPVFFCSPVDLISFLYPCSYSFCAIVFPYHFFGLARASLEIQILSRSLLVYRFCPFTDLPHLFRNGDRNLHTRRGP